MGAVSDGHKGKNRGVRERLGVHGSERLARRAYGRLVFGCASESPDKAGQLSGSQVRREIGYRNPGRPGYYLDAARFCVLNIVDCSVACVEVNQKGEVLNRVSRRQRFHFSNRISIRVFRESPTKIGC